MTRIETRRGVILVAVLWSIGLLAALAMAASTTFRSFTAVAAVSRDRVQADALLTAGLEAAAGVIAKFGETPLDSAETSLTLAAGSAHANISDEGGRIDIGRAPVEVLTGLLRVAGVPGGQAQALAQTLDSWRKPQDRGSTARGQPAGQEQQTDQPFTDVRQLANLPGMAPEWVAAMAPLATVFGSETVNPLTAPVPVLAALPGIRPAGIDALVAARRSGPDRAAGILPALGSAQKYLQIKSQGAASVRLSAVLNDGYTAAAEAVIVVLPQDRQPYRVLLFSPIPPWPEDGS